MQMIVYQLFAFLFYKRITKNHQIDIRNLNCSNEISQSTRLVFNRKNSKYELKRLKRQTDMADAGK